MKNDLWIKARIEHFNQAIVNLKKGIVEYETLIKEEQHKCPHNETEKWSNNDGDGGFTVQRCLICGKQEDRVFKS